MKKVFYFTFFILTILNNNLTHAQCVQAGNVIIDGYYGYPNVFSSAVKSVYIAGEVLGFDYGSFGPAGVKAEIMLSDNIGFGIGVNYANTALKWSDNYYDGFTSDSTTYNYKVDVNRLRILGIMNFHFATTDNLDPYFAVGAGYNNVAFKISSDDPTFDKLKVSGILPFALKLGIGFRYFFIPNVGINSEINLSGGPLVAGGISLKF